MRTMSEETKLPFEQLAKASGRPVWLIAAMRVGERLPVGFEMTRTAFDALAEKTLNYRFGS